MASKPEMSYREVMTEMGRVWNHELDEEQKRERDQFKDEQSGDESDEIPEVFVYPCFLRPGKQMFLVGNDDGNFYLHKFLAPLRIDYIPEFFKEVRTFVKERHFERRRNRRNQGR